MATRTHRTNYDIAATDSASAAFNRVQRAMQQTENVGRSLRNTLGSIGAGFSIGAFATALVTESREAEQASNRLVAVLRATGNAAGITKGELDQMAESVQDALGFDDESVRNAQSALLKFGNIQGDVFREGIRLSADLAAFMGTELPEAAQLIGKSLQSPTEGLERMERQFGKLTDEQEKHIKSLVSQGKTIEAQNAVLDLWRQKIGGTAELMNTGLTKATRDVTNAWGDMLAAIGKTETVGGTVIRILEGIRDIMRDIKGAAEGDPLGKMLGKLFDTNEELERLQELAKQPTTAAQRAGFGQASQTARAQIDARIAELKEQRKGLEAAVRALQSTGDPSTFDARDLRLRTPPRAPVLGGSGDEAAIRAASERARKLAELMARSAPQPLDARFDELTKFWAEVAVDAKGAAEEIKKAEEAQRRFLELQQKSIPVPPIEEFEDLERFWARQAVQIEKVNDVARELGFTFASAAEDAIVKWEGVRAVFQALLQDVLRVAVRVTATQPLAEGLAGFFSGLNLFGTGGPQQLSGPPGRAGGGDVMAGGMYMVGERGPELFVPPSNGAIVPNHALGSGVNIYQTNNFHGDFRLAARAEIQSMLPQIAEASANAVQDRERRGRRA